MFQATLYTVLSLFNLICFVGGVLVLPSEVPIHFDGLTADAVGSPWVFVALPAAAALISAAIWTASLMKRSKTRTVLLCCLSAVGAALAVLGWVFFALISSGVSAGETATFPIALCIILPLCFVAIFFGALFQSVLPPFFSRLEEKEQREISALLGRLFIAVGGVSALLCVILSCLAEQWSFLSAVLLVLGVALSFLFCLLRANSRAKGAFAVKQTEENSGSESEGQG